MSKKVRIAFFASGSGSNVENIVTKLSNETTIEFVKIYCNKPDAFVLQRAEKLQIPARVFTKQEFSLSDIILQDLLAEKIDLVILAGFLWMIPASLVKAFPNKIINIHPALLPKFGGKGMYGMHVHEQVVATKETETGITIHYVNEHYDDGPAILQAKVPVLPTDSPEDVANKVHALEYEYFPKAILEVVRKYVK